MKKVLITLTDKEHEELLKIKKKDSWHDFVLRLCDPMQLVDSEAFDLFKEFQFFMAKAAEHQAKADLREQEAQETEQAAILDAISEPISLKEYERIKKKSKKSLKESKKGK